MNERGARRATGRPIGAPTRGTTNPNRLRRVDRFCAGPLRRALLAAGERPVIVDLGFGATPVTSIELHERLLRFRPDCRLVGLEIAPARVAGARPWASENRAFLRGGFEVPLPDGWPMPALIRAFNVLRQYPEAAVPPAWALMTGRLAPGGRVIEGTCDELGRLASWVTLTEAGPETFTVSVRLGSLERPGQVAERLPKALIHRNVPGERIHDWLRALDDAWTRAAPLSAYGVRQRWMTTIAAVRAARWPVLHGPTRWRLGEVSVPWAAVAPGA